MNEELFASDSSLTFDDVLIVPGYSEILPSEVDIRAHLVAGISLNAPLLSAAMDTVTEARLAIAWRAPAASESSTATCRPKPRPARWIK
jgi:IMP dehydrogenase